MVVLCKNNNPYFDHFYLGNSNYLPFANLIFWFFSFLPNKLSLWLFVLLFSAIIGFFTYVILPKSIKKIDRYKYMFIICFLSYAYLICLDRANLEPFVAIAIMAFLFLYVKQQHKWAALFLAIAASTKIYPIIFVLLYVGDKKYKEVVLTAFYTILLILVPLYFQEGGFFENLAFILNGFELDLNTASFVGAFDDKGNKMIQGASLFSVLKIINIKMSLEITNMLTKYFVFVAIFTLFTVLYVVLIEKILWRKVTLLTCLIIILPHISFDYKLIHILFCFFLFINEQKSEIDLKFNYKLVAIIFGLLLVPKAYFYFNNIITTTSAKSDVSMGTFINPLLMISLCYIIIKSGMKHYGKEKIKVELKEHWLALKKSWIFILSLSLIIIPYYTYSKAAKEKYSIYKKHYLLAKYYLDNNKNTEAIAQFDSAFICKPYQFKLPLQIANIYNQIGKVDSAIVYFDKTLQIFPDCADALINGNNAKAIKSLNNKNFDDAITLFNKVMVEFSKLPSNPNNQGFAMGVYSNMCVCYINLQKWNDAKSSLNKIESIDPKNKFLVANLPYVTKMLEEKK